MENASFPVSTGMNVTSTACTVFIQSRMCSISFPFKLVGDICACVSTAILLFNLNKVLPAIRKKSKTTCLTITRKLALSLIVMQGAVCLSQAFTTLAPRSAGDIEEGVVQMSDVLHMSFWWIAGCVYSFYGCAYLLFYIQVLELSVLSTRRKSISLDPSKSPPPLGQMSSRSIGRTSSSISSSQSNLAMTLSKQSNKLMFRLQIVILLTLIFTFTVGLYGFLSPSLTPSSRDSYIAAANTALVLLYAFIPTFSFVVAFDRIRCLNKPKILRSWMFNQILSFSLPIIILCTDVFQLDPTTFAGCRIAIYFFWAPLCSAALHGILKRSLKQMKKNVGKVAPTSSERSGKRSRGGVNTTRDDSIGSP